LKGYSARPLEIRDGCNPIIQFCELHDGKHRHVLEWLQQIPKVVKPVDIEALGWSQEQLAAEDKEAMDSSPLCRELGDGSGPIVIIGEDKPLQPIAGNDQSSEVPATPADNDMLKRKGGDFPYADNIEQADRNDEIDAVNDEQQVATREDDTKDSPDKNDIKKEPGELSPDREDQPSKMRKKSLDKQSQPKKGDKKKTKGKAEGDAENSGSSSSEETSSITLSGNHSDSDDGDDEIDDEISDSSDGSGSVSNGDVLTSSSSDGQKKDRPPLKRNTHRHKSGRKRPADKDKTKKPGDGKKSKPKSKP